MCDTPNAVRPKKLRRRTDFEDIKHDEITRDRDYFAKVYLYEREKGADGKKGKKVLKKVGGRREKRRWRSLYHKGGMPSPRWYRAESWST